MKNATRTVVLVTAASIPAMVMSSAILVRLWRWFIIEQFNLPELSLASAMGISVIVSLLTSSYQQTGERSEDGLAMDLIGSILFVYLYPLFLLLIGYVVSLFL